MSSWEFQLLSLNLVYPLGSVFAPSSSIATWKNSSYSKLLQFILTSLFSTLRGYCSALHTVQCWKQLLHILSSFLVVFGRRVNTLTGSGSSILNTLKYKYINWLKVQWWKNRYHPYIKSTKLEGYIYIRPNKLQNK